MAKIDARQGLLGTRLAAHLLRRTTYQITPTRIAEFAGKTADEAVELLFNVPNLTHPEGPD
jgi:hypothetical protein